MMLWAGQTGHIYNSLQLTEVQRADPDSLLRKLKGWTKLKSNEFHAVTAFRHLEQGNSILAEFIDKATILHGQCNYP